MKINFVVKASVIGAVYAILTVVLAPISFGPVQIRAAEALTVLPVFTPAAVPGLAVGCFISNLTGPYGITDAVIGSFATLSAAVLSYLLRERKWLAPLPPVIINGIAVGCMLHFVYGIPNLGLCIVWVAAGQAGSCYVLGMLLMKLLENHRGLFD